jgi:hypothetical protein
MALYADVRKIAENEHVVEYSYTDVRGTIETLELNKIDEQLSPTSGQYPDYLYWEVARRIAVAWSRDHNAPNRLVIQA